MEPLLRKSLTIDHRSGYTDGHFEGHPIVPGAVSLQWMLEALSEDLQLKQFPSFKIRNLKCLQELAPPCEVKITAFEKKKGTYSVQLHKDTTLIATTDIILSIVSPNESQ